MPALLIKQIRERKMSGRKVLLTIPDPPGTAFKGSHDTIVRCIKTLQLCIIYIMYIKIISQEFEKYITSIFHWGVLQVRNYKKLSLKVLLSIYYFVTNFVKSIIFFLEQTLSQFVLTLYYFLSFLPRLSYFQGHRRQWWKFFRR